MLCPSIQTDAQACGNTLSRYDDDCKEFIELRVRRRKLAIQQLLECDAYYTSGNFQGLSCGVSGEFNRGCKVPVLRNRRRLLRISKREVLPQAFPTFVTSTTSVGGARKEHRSPKGSLSTQFNQCED